MLDLNNQNMCTAKCPCDAAAYANGYANTPESNFTFQGRTKNASPSNGAAPITLAAAGVTPVKTFADCVNGPIKSSTDQQKFSSYIGYLQFMKPFENQSSCSGWCTPALFWFTKEIGTMPTKACIKAIGASAGSGFAIPGFITIVASLIMLVIWLFQYFLWCEKKEPQWGN